MAASSRRPVRANRSSSTSRKYDLAVGEVGDGAKELGAATSRNNASDEPLAKESGRFRDEQTREKAYAADLKYLELEQRRGNLMVVAEFDQVANESAMRIGDVIDSLMARDSELTVVAIKEGENEMRTALQRISRQMRTDIVAAMHDMAKNARARAAAQTVETTQPTQIE